MSLTFSSRRTRRSKRLSTGWWSSSRSLLASTFLVNMFSYGGAYESRLTVLVSLLSFIATGTIAVENQRVLVDYDSYVPVVVYPTRAEPDYPMIRKSGDSATIRRRLSTMRTVSEEAETPRAHERAAEEQEPGMQRLDLRRLSRPQLVILAPLSGKRIYTKDKFFTSNLQKLKRIPFDSDGDLEMGPKVHVGSIAQGRSEVVELPYETVVFSQYEQDRNAAREHSEQDTVTPRTTIPATRQTTEPTVTTRRQRVQPRFPGQVWQFPRSPTASFPHSQFEPHQQHRPSSSLYPNQVQPQFQQQQRNFHQPSTPLEHPSRSFPAHQQQQEFADPVLTPRPLVVDPQVGGGQSESTVIRPVFNSNRTPFRPRIPYPNSKTRTPIPLPDERQNPRLTQDPPRQQPLFSNSIDESANQLKTSELGNLRPIEPVKPRLSPNQKLDLCCRKQRVQPSCQNICNFDTFNDRTLVSAFLTNQCPGTQLGSAFDCASTKVDHSECCIRHNLQNFNGGRCMTFCRTHLATPPNVFDYLPCLQVFTVFKNCYAQHQAEHPNIFGD